MPHGNLRFLAAEHAPVALIPTDVLCTFHEVWGHRPPAEMDLVCSGHASALSWSWFAGALARCAPFVSVAVPCHPQSSTSPLLMPQVLAVGRYKQEHGLKVTDPAREARVVQGLQRRNVGMAASV